LKNLGLKVVHILDGDIKINMDFVYKFCNWKSEGKRGRAIRKASTPSDFVCHPSRGRAGSF
jgi:hypothetical protein